MKHQKQTLSNVASSLPVVSSATNASHNNGRRVGSLPEADWEMGHGSEQAR